MTTIPSVCRECGITLVSGVNWNPSHVKTNSKICKSCHAEWSRNYRKTNVGQIRLYRKKYNADHKQEVIYWSRRYHATHKVEESEYRREYTITHTDQEKEYKRRWNAAHQSYGRAYRLSHKEETRKYDIKNKSQINANRRKRYQRDKTRILAYQHKRSRGLSTSIIIGKPFEGSHLHHMHPEVAICIPSWLHRSISHNIWTGKNMDKINIVALNWYIEQENVIVI